MTSLFNRKEINYFNHFVKKNVKKYAFACNEIENFIDFFHVEYDIIYENKIIIKEIFDLLHGAKKNNFKNFVIWYDPRYRKNCIRINFHKKNKFITNFKIYENHN